MEITPTIQKKIDSIRAEDIAPVKDLLVKQYKIETLERDIYFQEVRKFEGQIMETVKWLSDQEGSHAHVLEVILARANIAVKESKQKITLSNDNVEVIKANIEGEKRAVANYTAAINSCTGPLKEILTQIMTEEFEHIKRLMEYVK